MVKKKHFLDEINKQALEEKIDSFFEDKSFAKKILDNPIDLFFFVPAAYNIFMNNPQEFKSFYSKRFRKEAEELGKLSDKEKYGILIVKARQLFNNQQNDDFLSEDFKELNKINFPVKEKGSRSVHFGKFYDYQD